MRTEDFLDRLSGVKKIQTGYMAHCPAHQDRTPSLAVADAEDRILIYCFAGCKHHEIVGAMDLTEVDLFHHPFERIPEMEEPEARYIYEDANGNEVFRKLRFPGKRFVILWKGE